MSMIDRYQHAREEARKAGDVQRVAELDRKLADIGDSEDCAEVGVRPAGRGLAQRDGR